MNHYESRPFIQELGGKEFINPKDNYKKFKSFSLPISKNKFLEVSKRMNPIFCTFSKPISDYINRVGICILLHSSNIDAYDFKIFENKEIWIFHLSDHPSSLDIRFGYALLRHGALKVQIQCFPLEGSDNAK